MGSGNVCAQCGARYADPDDSCEHRFSALLALDHSRQEPWGSRHGSAFSAFTLQHPKGKSREALERCWTLLQRVWIAGDDPQYVAQVLRRAEAGVAPSWSVPPMCDAASWPHQFAVTIADLGDFDATTFAAGLEGWCRTTLDALDPHGKDLQRGGR
jgi:hypothetical protein